MKLGQLRSTSKYDESIAISVTKLMRLIFLPLLVLTLFDKQSERYYREKFAREIGRQVEVVIMVGIRCDILTAIRTIEVDFAKKWAESFSERHLV